MRAIVQRARNASVIIQDKNVASFQNGLMVLIGIEQSDDSTDADWLIKKIVNMRIFDDENGVMNESLLVKKYGIIIVSQFTLFASTKKGNRPSYIRAARPDAAIPLYEYFIQQVQKTAVDCYVGMGEFGADMQLQFTNDGPVTITLDSKNKE